MIASLIKGEETRRRAALRTAKAMAATTDAGGAAAEELDLTNAHLRDLGNVDIHAGLTVRFVAGGWRGERVSQIKCYTAEPRSDIFLSLSHTTPSSPSSGHRPDSE